MRNKSDLSELFEQGRKASPEAPVDKVLSVLETGKTSPLAAKYSLRPKRIKLFNNPLKILIMITPIIIISAAFLLINPTTNKVPVGEKLSFPNHQAINTINQEEKINQEKVKIIEPKQQIAKKQILTGKSLGIPVSQVSKIERDTVFTGIILDLSKEELTRLGFMFDEEGYYYLNKLPDGSKLNFWSWQAKQDTSVEKSGSNYLSIAITQKGGSFGFASGGLVNMSNKSKLNELDFYPVLTTDLNGEDLYPINQIKAKVYSDFELMNDTLVPVLFTAARLGGYKTGDKLIWFKVSDKFFDLLKTRQSELSRSIYNQVKTLLDGQLPANRVNYDFPSSLSLDNAIRLSPEILKCMGINYSKTTIDINIRAIEYWFKIRLMIINGGTSMSAKTTRVNPIKAPSDTLLPTTESIILLGISNVGNMKIVDMPTRVYRQLNRKDLTFQQYLNLCIPVMIDSAGLDQDGKETVFWIYPNERFFNCLPPEIAGPMKKEFDYHVHESFVITEDMPTFQVGAIKSKVNSEDSLILYLEPVPCVYFTNLCESLPGLDYVNLYPNPATEKLNVDLVLQKAKKIRFRVIDMGGRVITDYGAPENYPESGQFKYQMDISKLQSGLYMLVMTDEEGAKLSKRFVKN
jgi:hypothetical protein